ncbi:histidine phosphatase family protein [Marinobacter hydrocarbonoclasticus]|nr:histidine phosphatase family protein [Marinobacter nauticus]
MLLIRHAKSSWRIDDLADQYRPLSARGYREAPKIWDRLPFEPELWLCSPAIRAYSTARLIQAAPLQMVERLYPGSPEGLLAEVALLPESLSSVALVGHNPALEQLASALSGEPVMLKTSAMAWLRWEGTWGEMAKGADVTPIARDD